MPHHKVFISVSFICTAVNLHTLCGFFFFFCSSLNPKFQIHLSVFANLPPTDDNLVVKIQRAGREINMCFHPRRRRSSPISRLSFPLAIVRSYSYSSALLSLPPAFQRAERPCGSILSPLSHLSIMLCSRASVSFSLLSPAAKI